jgi:hypothetical protein
MILCSCAVTLTYYAIDKEGDHKPGPGPAKERVNESECWRFPLLRGGVAAPIKQKSRYLNSARPGRSTAWCDKTGSR